MAKKKMTWDEYQTYAAAAQEAGKTYEQATKSDWLLGALNWGMDQATQNGLPDPRNSMKGIDFSGLGWSEEDAKFLYEQLSEDDLYRISSLSMEEQKKELRKVFDTAKLNPNLPENKTDLTETLLGAAGKNKTMSALAGGRRATFLGEMSPTAIKPISFLGGLMAR